MTAPATPPPLPPPPSPPSSAAPIPGARVATAMATPAASAGQLPVRPSPRAGGPGLMSPAGLSIRGQVATPDRRGSSGEGEGVCGGELSAPGPLPPGPAMPRPPEFQAGRAEIRTLAAAAVNVALYRRGR